LSECGDDPSKLDNQFKRFSRQFNIDLAPKILFSKSRSVDDMIKSGVGNYLEFQNISDNFYFSSEAQKFVRIPFSKSEIFLN
jgi:RAB protein geranylgeranyltransferase component A